MAIELSWLPAPLQTTAKMLVAAATLVGSGWFVSDRVSSVVQRIDILELRINNQFDLQKVTTSYQIKSLETRVARLE